MNAWATYDSAAAHKLLTDNRDRYIAQSAATRNGEVAALPNSPPSPVATTEQAQGWRRFFSRQYASEAAATAPTPDEVAEAFAFKYGD